VAENRKKRAKNSKMRYREDIETRLTGRHKMTMHLSGEIKDREILNIGCWIGWYEKFATEHGCKLAVGIDTDYKAIIKANDSVNKANFALSSALELPFRDNCFDLVTMFDVIEHIPRNAETDCLAEVGRVLKNDGTLILSTPNSHFLAKILDPAWYLGHRHYSLAKLEGLLTKSGFQIESVNHGGGFYELLSMILLYIFKWLFRREMPFKRWFDKKRDQEYLKNKGFVTLFAKATKQFRVENMREVYPLISIVIVTWNRKKQITKCLDSVKKIIYPSLEVIVVDNNSTDGTAEEIEQNFPEVILVKNEENLMAAGGRNMGIRQAKGDFIFFLDSDNVVDKNVVCELVRVISQNTKIGVVGPKMYYYRDPNRIWFAGAEINLLTSKTTYIGHNETDRGQYNQIRETGHFPNAFLVRKDVIEKIGDFDEQYFIMYEESDFCLRANKAGFSVLYVPTAKVWHDVPLPSETANTLGYRGLGDKQRAYWLARNRILFMKKNARFYSYIIFLSVFLPLFTLYYTSIIILHRKLSILRGYLRGIYDGLF